MRRLTRSFVGPFAVHTVLGHFADRLFLSVKGVTGDGALTDADPLEAEVKATMIAHAEEAFLLIDDSKLQARGLNADRPRRRPGRRLRLRGEARGARRAARRRRRRPHRRRGQGMSAGAAPIIALRDASKSYGAVRAVRDTSIALHAGRGARARRRERRRQVDHRPPVGRCHAAGHRQRPGRRRARALPRPRRRARRRHRRHLPGADAVPRPVGRGERR